LLFIEGTAKLLAPFACLQLNQKTTNNNNFPLNDVI